MNKKIIKIIIIIVTVLFILLEGVYLLLVPAMINSFADSEKFRNYFLKKTSMSVSFETFKVRTYPDFSFKAEVKNAKIISSKNEKVFSSDYSKVCVRLFPLIIKKLSVKALKNENLYLVLNINKNKKIEIGDIELNLCSDKFKNVDLSLNGIKFLNSKIILTDGIHAQKTSVILDDAEFYYKKNKSAGLVLTSNVLVNDKNKTDLNIRFSSKLPLEKGLSENKFVLSGSIKNMDMSDFSPYFSAFDSDIQRISGILNAEFNNDNILDINTRLNNFSVAFKNPLDSVKANSEIKLGAQVKFLSHAFELKKLSLNADDWHILLNGYIKNYTSANLKDVKLDLNAEVFPSDINSLYWLVPSIKDDSMQVVQKLKKYGAWGKAQGKLQIKGDASCPKIYGKADLDDVYIVKNNPLVEHCKIFLDFSGDKVAIKTRVWVGFGEYVDIDGVSEMTVYGKGEFNVVSSPNVDLATAEYMLVPIHEIVGFDLGPVPFMKIQGKGNINIRTKGTVLDGKVEGNFNFNNLEASLEGLNTVLSRTSGTLVFDKKNMHFYTTAAYIKNKSLKIDGKANLDGNIDIDVTSDALDLEELFNILNTSSIIESHRHLAEAIEKISGPVSSKIKIKGIVKDFSTIKDNETLDISGMLKLNKATGRLKNIPLSLKNIVGVVFFDNDGWKIDVSGDIVTSKIFLSGFLKDKNAEINITGKSVNVDDLLKIAEQAVLSGFEKISLIGKTYSFVDFNASYKSRNGISFDINVLNNLKATGHFIPKNVELKPSLISKMSGDFSLADGVFTLKNFSSDLYKSHFKANARISNIFSEKPLVNGKINLSDFDLKQLNSIQELDCFPLTIRNLLSAYENYQGFVDSSLSVKNNNLDGFVNLKDIKFNHSYYKTPVEVDSGKILLNDSKITIKSMVANIDKTPVFMNFSVWDLDKTLKFDGYFTTKFTDKFANKYINDKLTYPVKPKGDITVTTDLTGSLDSVNIRTKLKIAQDADIYYMGANLGDEMNEREIDADINVRNNTYFIKKLDYMRYMTSQNDKSYPIVILTANGIFEKYINHDKKSFFIKNFNIQTLNNANVKIFNVIFKKSILKNGMFNCKLNLKGDINNPAVKGNVIMNNIDMPLYETIVKNITLNFRDKFIDISADGAVLNSDFVLSAQLLNTFSAPYIFENIDIKSKQLNLNKFIDALIGIPTPNVYSKMVGTSSKNNIPLNVSDVQIKKGSLSVKDILIRDLPANNCVAEFSLGNDIVLNIKNIAFDVAGGKMTGSAVYDFNNGKIKTSIKAFAVDANKIASNLFEFKEQIFGQAHGSIDVSTTGSTEDERVKNMLGTVYFEITDGKMPKLGSVEYLLKAGNVIKSGITGASLNNLLTLLTPVRTGYFNSIRGNFVLKNGVAQNIEVYSKGDNLNIYINGDYDILLQYADLRVFGRLTKNATNILGAVGNLSFNSILNSIPGIKLGQNDKNSILKEINKIPGVEFSDKSYRIFTVKIAGKVNEDRFVKNFRWVE